MLTIEGKIPPLYNNKGSDSNSYSQLNCGDKYDYVHSFPDNCRFNSQQEIWKHLLEGGKIIEIDATHDAYVHFLNGTIHRFTSDSCVRSFYNHKEWVKYEVTNWYDRIKTTGILCKIEREMMRGFSVVRIIGKSSTGFVTDDIGETYKVSLVTPLREFEIKEMIDEHRAER